jgi:hypothetical protein
VVIIVINVIVVVVVINVIEFAGGGGCGVVDVVRLFCNGDGERVRAPLRQRLRHTTMVQLYN